MAANSVTIVDGGGANIASLRFALSRLEVEATLSRDPAQIRASSHVILPGVGAAADAMSRLATSGLDELIPTLSQPVLGICLGMQLLASESEENDSKCLDVIPGRSRKLAGSTEAPVPNMGWCRISTLKEHPILTNVPDDSYFYFVHSYALPVSEFTVASADHTHAFSAVYAKDNFVATQFHPERSSRAGEQVLKNFVGLPS